MIIQENIDGDRILTYSDSSKNIRNTTTGFIFKSAVDKANDNVSYEEVWVQ